MPKQMEVPLTFSGGLVNQYGASVLPEGTASTWENYEPMPNGGIRPRRRWQATSGTIPTVADMKTRGTTASFVTAAGVRQLVLANYEQGYGGGAADVISFTNFDAPGTPWDTADARFIPTLSDLPVAFAAGNSYLLWSHPSMPSARIRKWNGGHATATDAETNGLSGRALIYHLNRFFVGGSVLEPSMLRWTEVGSNSNWNITENFIPISQDDGEPIEDLAIFDRGLIIGKESSLWYMSGLTPDSFTVQPLSVRIGVAPGRSIVAAPDGIYCVSQTGIYFWNGGSLNRISGTIDYQMLGTFVTATFVDDKLYVSDQGGPLWIYDPANQRWWQDTYGETVDGPGSVSSFGETLIAGSIQGTTYPALYRNVVTGGRGSDEVQDSHFEVSTEQKWLAGPYGTKFTLKSVYLRYTTHDSLSGTATLHIEVTNEEGDSQDLDVQPSLEAGTFQTRLDTALVGQAFTTRIYSDVEAPDSGSFDIEDCRLFIIAEESLR